MGQIVIMSNFGIIKQLGCNNNNWIGACSRIVHQTYFGEKCEEKILGYEEIKQKSKYERCVW